MKRVKKCRTRIEFGYISTVSLLPLVKIARLYEELLNLLLYAMRLNESDRVKLSPLLSQNHAKKKLTQERYHTEVQPPKYTSIFDFISKLVPYTTKHPKL
jgi:hypothetical protein